MNNIDDSVLFGLTTDNESSADTFKQEFDNLGKKYDTNKKVLGFVNTLIGEYGVRIRMIKKSRYNKITHKQDLHEYYFKFENIKIIQNIN